MGLNIRHPNDDGGAGDDDPFRARARPTGTLGHLCRRTAMNIINTRTIRFRGRSAACPGTIHKTLGHGFFTLAEPGPGASAAESVHSRAYGPYVEWGRRLREPVFGRQRQYNHL